MAGSVIVTGARTPIGKLSGGLAPFSAQQLGGFVIKAALERAGLSPDEVDYVFMGQVLGAGQGQITARQAAVNGGVPMTVPATTVNKVCLSGLNTIYLADQMIQAGEADIVIAGGMESMTNAPHILPGSRAGFRYGDADASDAISGTACGALSTPASWVPAPRSTPLAGTSPASVRTSLPRRATSVLPPRSRTVVSPTRSSPSRSRSARVIRCCSTPTRVCARARRRSHSAR